MQVAHDITDFQDGQERILVLKDSSILENEDEGDQLVSIQLEEQQRLKKNLENKKKKPVYSGYDDEEFNFGGGITKKGLLSHYDEEIEGEKRNGFMIETDGVFEVDNKQITTEKPKSISLTFDKMREIQDYYTREEAEVEFKKPKKIKKKKKVRKKTNDDDDLTSADNNVDDNKNNEMEIDNTRNQRRRLEDLDEINFVDDDDLQQALARARKMATKNSAKNSVEEIARTCGWKDATEIQQEQDNGVTKLNEEPKYSGVVEEEPLVSGGMAATLALLQQKGFSIKPSEEQLDKERVQRERQKWLGEQRKRDLERQTEREREKQRAKEKGYRGGAGRDSDSSYREREHLREMEARFKDYKPDINLEYVDEFGNQLTPKEAFRQLSHKFHGKSSGKSKTEKRLKKLDEERKLKAMSSIDTPLNMANALQERQKASGSAHVVLSIGNRAVVPPSVTSNTDVKKAQPGNTSVSGPNIITVNGGLTGQSMNAPEREKVTFGLKRKAEKLDLKNRFRVDICFDIRVNASQQSK
ncbi:5653_t:CDS:10 [Diversispora eburnea]|uniref:5653_t:CDS:1 n=1 Tax=Diversispora eburnea TaxID=1213867 RepID=A0A9N8ZGZ6_9GLOM|nr:5653_t:CDS:10 [Diversispora eburnea]